MSTVACPALSVLSGSRWVTWVEIIGSCLLIGQGQVAITKEVLSSSVSCGHRACGISLVSFPPCSFLCVLRRTKIKTMLQCIRKWNFLNFKFWWWVVGMGSWWQAGRKKTVHSWRKCHVRVFYHFPNKGLC